MKVTLFIAKKYLWAKRRTGFISVIAWISMAGVALGTAALILTLCIITGFERELRTRFVSFDSHIRIKSFDDSGFIRNPDKVRHRLMQYPQITGVSAYLEKEAMIRAGKKAEGVIVKGLDPSTAEQTLSIRRNILDSLPQGALNLKPDSETAELSANVSLPGILIGKKLADKLMANVGDRITVFSLQNTLAFIKQPKVRQFRVTGIYRSGLAEYDNVLVYIDLNEAQSFFDAGDAVSGFEIRTDNLFAAETLAKELSRDLGFPYFVRTWFDLHRNLFAWLENNNFIMTIIFSLIILVAAFNIIGTLFMIVLEKTRDIGILRSMGSRAADIRRIFLFEGLWIGMIGSGIGIGLALLLAYIQLEWKILSLKSDVYFMDSVPVEMNPLYFLLGGLFSTALCMLAALLPAIRAARLDPVEAIRYE